MCSAESKLIIMFTMLLYDFWNKPHDTVLSKDLMHGEKKIISTEEQQNHLNVTKQSNAEAALLAVGADRVGYLDMHSFYLTFKK